MNLTGLITLVIPFALQAGVYDLPPCYLTVPTSCTFNDMTLEMCNKEGKKSGTVFLISTRDHLPGGNIFRSAQNQYTCTVKRINNSDPPQYNVTVSR